MRLQKIKRIQSARKQKAKWTDVEDDYNASITTRTQCRDKRPDKGLRPLRHQQSLR